MGVFIRSIHRQRYYAGRDQWPLNQAEAFDFRSSQLAREWIHTVKLNDVEIVFEDPAIQLHDLTSNAKA